MQKIRNIEGTQNAGTEKSVSVTSSSNSENVDERAVILGTLTLQRQGDQGGWRAG